MIEGKKRKVSPRAPSMPLDEAIARVAKLYKEDGRHPAPVEVAMRHIGYSSKSGTAIAAIASLGYWGLVERPKDGMVMVTKAFEDYEFTPDEAHKQELLVEFLRKPPLFASLLEQYKERLPSDATIRYDLIQRGFIPSSAATCMAVFKRSVEFVRYFDRRGLAATSDEHAETETAPLSEVAVSQLAPGLTLGLTAETSTSAEDERGCAKGVTPVNSADPTVDRIPVRLSGGRRAWLEIPMPFFSADKKRLKKHIDLLLTDDEDEAEDEESSNA